ncbi:type II toxin-antitoxin system HicA family toxin [Candidatus Poriferisocius sp.]|uniref:type II toxin-antitoxin system HicA family toxin n=1 Tax=Candidatus Poriferisocius sp. TaxID=3101276 RepID=UPI003B525E1B
MAYPASRFPALKPTKVLRLLHQIGYREVPGRGKGSHTMMKAAGKKTILVPMHKGKEVAPAHLRKMLVEDAALTDAEIDALL